MLEAGDEIGIAGDEAAAHPRRARALGERVEDEDIAEIAAAREAGLERTGGRRLIVDLAIALVDGEHEIEIARQLDRLLQVVETGYGALRVGGRAEIEERAALEMLGLDRGEIG